MLHQMGGLLRIVKSLAKSEEELQKTIETIVEKSIEKELQRHRGRHGIDEPSAVHNMAFAAVGLIQVGGV